MSRLAAEPGIGSVWWALLFPESEREQAPGGSDGSSHTQKHPDLKAQQPSPMSPKSSFWAPRKQSGQTSLPLGPFPTQNKQGEGRH